MSTQTDHALIIHVWHLDTLDELSAYAAHFTPNADCFVTFPDSFSAEIRKTIADIFPASHQVPVENRGQDVGALFQLMDQVDLSRYEFICKIHTKKGRAIPHEWREALLRGVLGSPEQVAYIVRAFREDPDVQLAGARQLFLHGNMNLGSNDMIIKEIFGSLVKDFNIHQQGWGFIAGTCFWIRTTALLQLHACEISFDAADGYTPDGTTAHAVERMFGMYAALCDGKVLLQDLRFPDRMPDIGPSLPDNLPKGDWQLIPRTLTSLVGGAYPQVNGVEIVLPTLPDPPPKNRKRIAVFASYSSDGFLPQQVLPYLAGLKSLTEAIVVVCDNDLAPGEREKLAPFAAHVIVGRHGEYDFGSYKRGTAWARENGLLNDADDLILCNDSCYGPVNSFAPMFATMEARELDFWGATDSHEFSYHLQSYWVVLSRKAFASDAFKNFIRGVKKQENVQQVIQNYELGLTKTLVNAGFTVGALVKNKLKGVHPKDSSYDNLTLFPIYALKRGLPLVKGKALRATYTNMDGQNHLLGWLRENAPTVYELAISDINIRRFEDADDEAFSLIMPTRNRAWCISRAITSVMAQTHRNFELLIIDDGSTDGTEEVVAREFEKELAEGRIRYIRLTNNVGVSSARNIGLAHARNPWIGYVDSDNSVRPYYLTMIANAIVEYKDYDAFYGKIINVETGRVIGKSFIRDALLKGNFIDLGVFVHRKALIDKFGWFDPSLKRLVDWDLVIKFTNHQPPKFISQVFLEYTDAKNKDRISVKESFIAAEVAIHNKYSVKPTVSTAIICYNHQEYLVEAIESALAQTGDYTHEIMISDDGSTDGSQRIIDHYARKYPHQIRDISRGSNFGISENYKHCFREAAGEFVAILEGDDYWTDVEKNRKQAEFLKVHPEAAMVFSMVQNRDMRNNGRGLFARQHGLKSLLTGDAFAADENLNLIVNLSTTMYVKKLMQLAPSSLYEPRISEIALAFYFDRIGRKIGFIDEVMSVYRLHAASVWSGASYTSKLEQAIAIRENALRIAKPKYHALIREHIEEKQAELAILKRASIGKAA